MLKQPHAWQRLNHRIASMSLAAWFFSLTFHHLDRAFIRLSRGRTSLTSWLTGLPVVTLTTIGAKSGQSRSVPLIGIPDGDKVVLIASNWGQRQHPAWYHNLRAHPEAELFLQGQTRAYTAHEASGAEYETYWQRAVGLYVGYAAYKPRTGGRVIPIMVLLPKAS